MNKKQIYSWALYDWANSAFATTAVSYTHLRAHET